MDTQTDHNLISYSSFAFEQRLNDIAWPIKCHWAKHFPIRIVTHVEYAAIDFDYVYVHPDLSGCNDSVLFCMMAHEWAHRMVSPKSQGAHQRIIESVAKSLNINQRLAHLVSAPAIEAIVDRCNCEIEAWNTTYRQGFTEAFTRFVEILQQKKLETADADTTELELNKMILAMRLANVNTDSLPAYIRPCEIQARNMLSILFDGWDESSDATDPDHIKKITRFSEAFHAWLPKDLLNDYQRLEELLAQIVNTLDDVTQALITEHGSAGRVKNANAKRASRTGEMCVTEAREEIFDLALTRQVTDHLMHQAHKHRQITGLWQPGHAFSKLDMKRSFRCSPILIAGMTTRRKIDSNRVVHVEGGKQIKLCLLVDDSASMTGNEARFSRSICEGINRFASLKELHLGLITFGSDIHIALPPQRRYHRLTHAFTKLNGNLGGTNLLPALQKLAHFVESDVDITHAVLISDASFYDWDECAGVIDEILTCIKLTVLMINCDMPEDLIKTLKCNPDTISFFKVDPFETPSHAILEEIIR